MSNKPTIVWVPGAWTGPEYFFGVGQALEEHGYTNSYIRHASVGAKGPLDDPYEDTKIVRKEILKILDEDGSDVVLAMHSYGGVPGTNAAYGLGRNEREAQGKKTAVVNLAFVCSFCLPKDTTLFETLGGKPLPWFRVHDGYVTIDNAGEIAMNDCTTEQKAMMESSIQSHALNTFTDQKVDHDTYKEIPSSYLVCTKDNAIPEAVQRKMIQDAGPQAFQLVEELDASHSPFISKPTETANFLRRAAGEKL